MTGRFHPWSGDFTRLSAEDQRAVAELVVKGKAVSGTVDELIGRLERTRCVALLRDANTDRIVGAAAWKRPGPGYRITRFEEAGAPITGFERASELGYVVRAPDLQGGRLSGGLVDAIMERVSEPTFATTGSNTMRAHLERVGFERVGRDWEGKSGPLSLWTIIP